MSLDELLASLPEAPRQTVRWALAQIDAEVLEQAKEFFGM